MSMDSDFVLLDLNNFKLGGGSAGTATLTAGIYSSNRSNITVRNGNIRGFAYGILIEGTATVPPPPPPLLLACQAQPREGAVPLTVSFRSFPSGGTGTYAFDWRFGDDGASPSPIPTPLPFPDLVITIVGNLGASSYSPNPADARVGQRVIWRNADVMTHTATSGGTFDTGFVGPGASSAPITMSTVGTFSYLCTLHPGMAGTLRVTP